jgi:hypothetical protein
MTLKKHVSNFEKMLKHSDGEQQIFSEKYSKIIEGIDDKTNFYQD